MYVRGTGFHRLVNQVVHHLDHRCLAGEFLELLNVIQELDGIDLVLFTLGSRLDLIALFDSLINFRAYADTGNDLLAGEQRQCFQYIAVLGIGHGHGQTVVLLFEYQRPVFLEKLVRDILVDG